MNKTNVKTLRDLYERAAALYGDGIFLKEKCGKDIVEKTIMSFFEILVIV